MTERDTPAALRMLADTLRQVRVDAGLSQEEFAARLNFSRSLVGMVESGAQFPSAAYVAQVDQVFTQDDRLQRLHRIASTDDRAGRLGQLVDAETAATLIRSYHPIHMPGLLQTKEYARAVIGGGIFAVQVQEEVDERVDYRIKRQQILNSAEPPKVWVILNEAVLFQTVGDREVMRDQLAHILDLTRTRRQLRVQILPRSEGRHAPAGPMTVIDTPDGKVVHLDSPGAGRTTGDLRTIQECIDWFDVLRSQAASLTESARMMAERIDAL